MAWLIPLAIPLPVVETIFARVWPQRESWKITTNLRAYLYLPPAIRCYQVLDYRRHEAVKGRVRDRSTCEAVSPGRGALADPHMDCETAELDAAFPGTRHSARCGAPWFGVLCFQLFEPHKRRDRLDAMVMAVAGCGVLSFDTATADAAVAF